MKSRSLSKNFDTACNLAMIVIREHCHWEKNSCELFGTIELNDDLQSRGGFFFILNFIWTNIQQYRGADIGINVLGPTPSELISNSHLNTIIRTSLFYIGSWTVAASINWICGTCPPHFRLSCHFAIIQEPICQMYDLIFLRVQIRGTLHKLQNIYWKW